MVKIWLLSMPGLTGSLLLEKAEELGLSTHGQMVNLSSEQWGKLKQLCQEALGLHPNWEEHKYAEAVTYARTQGFGTLYGPNGQAHYKVRGGPKPVDPKPSEKEDQVSLW